MCPCGLKELPALRCLWMLCRLKHGALAVACFSAPVLACVDNSTNATVTGQAHDSILWWTHPYEVFHLEEVTIVVLVAITLMVDSVQHQLAKYTRSRGFWSDDFEEDTLHEIDHRSREPMAYLLFNRGTAEFTVLGIIACIVWACNRTGVFYAIYELTEDVEDIALPQDAAGYHHNVESVHMHLFVTYFLYYAIMACSIFVAGRWMRSWAASNVVYKRQIRAFRAGKDCSEEFIESDWPPEHVTLRQTFLMSVSSWRKASDRLDTKLQAVVQKYRAEMDEDRIQEFLTTRFPFTPYVVENYRDMLENMVIVRLETLACIGVIEGVQATFHRFQVDFDFSYAWIGVFALVLAVLYLYSWIFHHKLLRGQYLKEDLSNEALVKLSSVPGRICLLIQVCSLLFCFALTRPLAHSYVWILSQARSIAHSVACLILIPIAGLLLGNLLAQLAVVLSCLPQRPVNEARIRLIWDRHILARIVSSGDIKQVAVKEVMSDRQQSF